MGRWVGGDEAHLSFLLVRDVPFHLAKTSMHTHTTDKPLLLLLTSPVHFHAFSQRLYLHTRLLNVREKSSFRHKRPLLFGVFSSSSFLSLVF